MNIIERNFYRLLRAGAFGTQESIEPLSAWKWNRLYQMAEMHDVAPTLYQGVKHCSDQFLLQVPQDLLEKWCQARCHEVGEENDMLQSDHLTNPLLNHQLQTILDSEDSTTETRATLLHLLGIARFIMNAGIPVKRTMEFGMFLKQESHNVNFIMLDNWIAKLKLSGMAQLTGVMLVKLMAFSTDEIPFMTPMPEAQMQQQIDELFRQKNSHAEDWYFSQGKDIFVHTSNSSAMLWHVRRSAKYFKYYPTEATTNFFTSFAHSLSHIEE